MAKPQRLAGVALVALYLGRWPFRSRHLYEWDAAQYALGTLDFDIYKHQPHPPGYPVWILLLKAVHLVVSDLNTMQVVAAFILCAVAAVAFYRFAAEVQGPTLALFSTACAFYAPPAVVASVTANTYPIDLLGSVSLGWLAARMWSGEKRLAPIAAVLLALMAGARQTGAVVLVPLVGVSLVLACRFDWRAWAKTLLAGGIVFAAWYLPVAQMHGGIVKLQTFQNASARMIFSKWSYFHGAPAWAHLSMLREAGDWLELMLLPTVVLCALVFAVGRALAPRTASTVGVRPDALHEREDESNTSDEAFSPSRLLRISPFFYVLWITPNVVMCALHCPKPGYMLGTLPPIVLACTTLAGRGMREIAARFHRPTTWLAAALSVIAAGGSTVLSSIRYEHASYNRSSLSGVRQVDDGTEAIFRAAGPSIDDQNASLIIELGGNMWFGANYRTLSLDLDAEVWRFENEVFKRTSSHHVEHPFANGTHVIPERIRRIVWVHDSQAELPASIFEAFPNTRFLPNTPTRRVWISDIGNQKVDVSFPLNLFTVHVTR